MSVFVSDFLGGRIPDALDRHIEMQCLAGELVIAVDRHDVTVDLHNRHDKMILTGRYTKPHSDRQFLNSRKLHASHMLFQQLIAVAETLRG